MQTSRTKEKLDPDEDQPLLYLALASTPEPQKRREDFDDCTNKLLVEICSPQKIYLVEK
jgi:hypothetical protein